AIRFGPAIKAFLLCLLIGGSGIGYVWQQSQIDELGKQRWKREQELRVLQAQNRKLRDQLLLMNSVKYLETKVKELNLGLVQAQPSQKWLLREAPPETHARSSEGQYAAQ
ncbi:MAG TPA: hypothetical protein VK327_12255, partial [Candidatus Paceibacterota bacterium]|nr:hypothetical protein [Candidatus Paceibacterota bacterium]